MGLWRDTHQLALPAARAALFETRERTVIAVLLWLVAMGLVWLLGDHDDVRGEIILSFGATVALGLVFPGIYVWQFVKSAHVAATNMAAKAAEDAKRPYPPLSIFVRPHYTPQERDDVLNALRDLYGYLQRLSALSASVAKLRSEWYSIVQKRFGLAVGHTPNFSAELASLAAIETERANLAKELDTHQGLLRETHSAYIKELRFAIGLQWAEGNYLNRMQSSLSSFHVAIRTMSALGPMLNRTSSHDIISRSVQDLASAATQKSSDICQEIDKYVAAASVRVDEMRGHFTS